MFPLPDREACARILEDCVAGLGKTFPAIAKLASSPKFERCAAECAGLDGRAIRKMVASALASRPQTAMEPERVTIDDLFAAVRDAKAGRKMEGIAP